MLGLLATLLRTQGYQVRTACTGAEGIAAAQDPAVALVLLDVMLPEMSGFDVCLKIKEQRPFLPVIILSALAQPIDMVTGLDCGADDYVAKPFVNSVLLARVRAGLRTVLINAVRSQPQPVEEAAARTASASQSAYGADQREDITGIFRQAESARDRGRALAQPEDRTIEPEQLRQASEFLSVISHELRAPVAAIKGFITTLLSNHRQWDDQEREAFLANVNENVDRLSRIFENVLEMGRLDKGLEPHRRPTRLVTLVQRVLHDLSFQPSRCELVNEVPAYLPPVAIDPLRIERVLRNLVENAIKFSPAGGKICVFARLMEDEIEVGVQDQGIGIAPEHLPYIFERFYQADRTGPYKEGIGLGLYIAKELVQAHGGQIRAESQVGHGTTMRFTLPLDDRTGVPTYVQQGGTLSAPLPQYPSSGSHQPDTHSRVLIVEDDPQTLQSLRKSLEAKGFETLTTSYGSEAIELVENEELDLILLDLFLPDIDGLVVCESVRRCSNVPIIIITGRKTEFYKTRGLGLGADDYLTKPFSTEELLARVHAVLRRAQAPGRSEGSARLRFDGLEIDPVHYEVKTCAGPVRLTPTEHKLLYYLAANAGRILTHEQLLTKVWGYESSHQTQYLWVNISRLRKKIEPDPDQPRYVLTEPGVGYCFRKPDELY